MDARSAEPPAFPGIPPTTVAGLTGAELEAVAVLWKRDRREVVARFGGASMAPTILPGAEILLACGTRPAAGEIAAFIFRGRIMVHRVIARAPGGTWLLTRGDATALPDPPITDEAVIGRVEWVRAGDRRVAPSPAPTSTGRRAVLALSLVVLRRSETAARLLIRLLWEGRRWLILAPRALVRRAAAAIKG